MFGFPGIGCGLFVVCVVYTSVVVLLVVVCMLFAGLFAMIAV